MLYIRRLFQKPIKGHENSSNTTKSISILLIIGFLVFLSYFFIFHQSSSNARHLHHKIDDIVLQEVKSSRKYIRNNEIISESIENDIKIDSEAGNIVENGNLNESENESLESENIGQDIDFIPDIDVKDEISMKNEEIHDNSGCLTVFPSVDNGPHIVRPPDGPVTIVCCKTTKGNTL